MPTKKKLKTKFSLYVEQAQLRELRSISKQTGTPMSHFIRIAIDNILSKLETHQG